MSIRSNVSRRNFMRTAAAAAASAPVMAASVSASDASSTFGVLAAATVVRATVSPTKPGTLHLGVRVSVQAEGYQKENLVVSVDGVKFNAAADDTRHAITTAVRDRVATELARHGNAISAEQVAVQVFGGVL